MKQQSCVEEYLPPEGGAWVDELRRMARDAQTESGRRAILADSPLPAQYALASGLRVLTEMRPADRLVRSAHDWITWVLAEKRYTAANNGRLN